MLEYIPLKFRKPFMKYSPIAAVLSGPNRRENRKKLADLIRKFSVDLLSDGVPQHHIDYFAKAPPKALRLEQSGLCPNWERSYPPTSCEELTLKFNRKTISIMKKWKGMKPFQPKEYSPDAVSQKLKKFRWLSDSLSEAYGIDPPKVIVGNITAATWDAPMSSGRSCYHPRPAHSITIDGKFSVITFLHEFGHSRGFDEVDTVTWSTNLFRIIFPNLYSGLSQGSSAGHTLVRN